MSMLRFHLILKSVFFSGIVVSLLFAFGVGPVHVAQADTIALAATPAPGQLSASCSASPTSPATGDVVTWTASVSGGTTPYTYSWTGTDGLSGALKSASKVYTAAGAKNATVTVSTPSGSSPGTWTLTSTDYSDLACPVTNLNAVYSKMANCPANPAGTACTVGSSPCKVNTSQQTPGTCGIHTDIYNCQASAGSSSSVSPSVTASCSVTVTAPSTPTSLPDLTAGSVTPTTATPGSPVTLSAPVTNQGEGSTVNGFSDLFEINPDAIPATFDDIRTLRTYASSALAAGAGNTMSVSYTFATAGTYYVRACADLKTDNTGTITESNENNNCGDWVSVAVGVTPDFCSTHSTDPSCTGGTSFCAAHPTDPSCTGGTSFCAAHPTDPSCTGGTSFCATHPTDPSCISGPPPTSLSAFLIAEPPSISYGLSSHLIYTCAGAKTASIDQGIGNISPVSGGTIPISPSATTQYTLTCKDASGTPAWYPAIVTVTAPVPSIQASPAFIRSGGTSVISWSVSGKVDSCSVSGPGLFSKAVSGASAQTIANESVYTISCTAGSFHASQSVTVKIIPGFREF